MGVWEKVIFESTTLILLFDFDWIQLLKDIDDTFRQIALAKFDGNGQDPVIIVL